MLPRQMTLLAGALALLALVPALEQARPSAEELRGRRQAAMTRLPDGILLLHARSSLKAIDQGQFRQDPTFYYFTGLDRAMNAILALDGPRRESWLFVPPPGPFERSNVAAGLASQQALGIDHVVGWDGLVAFLDGRLAASPRPVLYTDPGGFAAMTLGEVSNPPGLAPIENRFLLWAQALRSRWPEASVQPAGDAILELRLLKSPEEIERLRSVGRASAAALRAGLAALRPGRRQREVEAAIVSGCVAAGAEGPSFWPWAMTGPNAAFPAPFEAFADYHHLDRRMQAGELARMDVGCAAFHYEGDVGRTAPVSGRFDPGQRETWTLLLGAYRAGLAEIQDGARWVDVLAASLADVARRQPGLKTELGTRAAQELLREGGARFWQAHGVGLDSAEGTPAILRAGMVLAFEPIFSADGQGFYLEDMLLVTAGGHEILTPGLPYTADEIETAVLAR